MNIRKENLDDLNAVIRIGINPDDYQPKVDAALAEHSKKARIDGFRPGKVPPSLLRKKYGKSILAEEIQHLLSDYLNNYIRDNQLNVLGEPLVSINSPKIDWDNQETFEFHFDIAMAPNIELNISPNDPIIDYKINVTPEMIDEQIEAYSRQFGSLKPAETISDEDVVRGDLCELSDHDHEHIHEHDSNNDQDHDKHHPVHSHGALIYIKTIGDDTLKKQFLGSHVGDKLIFNPNAAFPNETDRSNLLKVAREELKDIDSDFEFTISEISRFTSAEIDQVLFDKVFGEGTIDSVEAFRERINTDLENRFSHESRRKLHADAKIKLMTDTYVPLPEEFLKRWMLVTSKDESLTREKMKTNFPAFAVDLKWRLIKNKIIAEQKLEATDDEIREQAIWVVQSRYFQYGIYNAAAEQLFRQADLLMNNEDDKARIADGILEHKTLEQVVSLFELAEQHISLEEFNKLIDENK